MRTRRTFLTITAATLLSRSLPAQNQTRLNLAVIDHDRILSAARAALTTPAVPSGNLQSQAFLDLTLQVPALAAAHLIDPDPKYPAAAFTLLETWFLNPATRPTLELSEDSYEPLIDLAPLAETAVAIPQLGLEPAQTERLKKSFAKYLTFLTEDRTALLARDSKSHHASAWLLQVAAFARLTGNAPALADATHRFKTQFIRAQIDAAGAFPHELTTENPYRNSLFNLDLLAGAAVLLTTRFDSPWDHELQDGPGLRSAIAHHAPYIANRKSWPYPSDQTLFNQLPGRRPALLFAARAYAQPDYATLWRTLPPTFDSPLTDPTLLRTFPIRQPILWQPSTRT